MRHKIFVVLLASLAIGLGTTARVLADSLGPRNGGSFANDSSSGGNILWTNPANAASSNNSYATAAFTVSGDLSYYLKATNFGFTIPTGATIDGIKVEFERSKNISGMDSISTFSVSLVKGGTISGNNYGGTTWETSEVYETFGGTADKWGLTWTAADINASNFGVVVSASADELTQAVTARVDHIRITVYYTPAAAVTPAPTSIRRSGTILLTGYAFPEGKIIIYENNFPIQQHTVKGQDGRFSIEITSYEEKPLTYNFLLLDREGRATPLQSLTSQIAFGQEIKEDLSPPPTISIQKTLLTKGESLVVTGFAAPRAQVEILVNEKVIKMITAGAEGQYTVVVNTTTEKLAIGAYTVGARQRFPVSGEVSGLSLVKKFIVSPFGTIRGDFNGDGIVDIKDWSIFLVKRNDPTVREKLDLDGDGKIGVVDLSIFLRIMVIGR